MADEKQAIASLEKRIDNQMRKIRTSNVVTIGIGMVIILAFVIYFSILGPMVRQLTDERELSAMVVEQGRQYIPELRARAATRVQTDTIPLVERGVDMLLDQVTPRRVALEDALKQEVDGYMNQWRGALDERVAIALDQNADEIRAQILNLLNNEGLEETEDALYSAIEPMFTAPEMEHELEAYAMTLHALNRRMERIVHTSNLSEEERIERAILVALKEFSDRSR